MSGSESIDKRPVSREDLEGRNVEVEWIGVELAQVVFSNQFIIQSIDDECFLTLGQATPPVVLGTEEERIRKLLEIEAIPVRTLGRYGFNRARLRELATLLNDHVARWDSEQNGGTNE